MENNTNTNTANNENTIQAIETLARVIKKYAAENECFENAQICKFFNEFVTIKNEEKDEAIRKALNKLFWSFFSPYEAAKIKLVTKVGNKVTKTNEANKAILNVILQPYEVQKKKVRNLLSATLNKGQFALHFTKKAYMAEYDNLSETDFAQLYKGANTIQSKTLVSFLAGRLIEKEKEQKRAAK